MMISGKKRFTLKLLLNDKEAVLELPEENINDLLQTGSFAERYKQIISETFVKISGLVERNAELTNKLLQNKSEYDKSLFPGAVADAENMFGKYPDLSEISRNNLTNHTKEISQITDKHIEERKKIQNEFKKELFDYNKTAISYAESVKNSVGSMWDKLIIGGRKAKDPWDAIWIAMRNSALKSLGEVIKSGLFEQIKLVLAGSPGNSIPGESKQENKGLFAIIGSLLTEVLPFFGTGGVVTKPTAAIVGDVPEAIIPLHQLNSILNHPADNIMIEKVLSRIEQWQTDFKVHNDIMDLNQKIKTFNTYKEKYSF